MAREALKRLIEVGRPMREAASFLAEQCFEGRLHGWAYVNTDELTLVPGQVWQVLMWAVLPDEDGVISSQTDKISIVGNWRDGRIGYYPKSDRKFSKSYAIQGLRFDRDEFDSLLPDTVEAWSCDPIGAKPLIDKDWLTLRQAIAKITSRRLDDHAAWSKLREWIWDGTVSLRASQIEGRYDGELEPLPLELCQRIAELEAVMDLVG